MEEKKYTKSIKQFYDGMEHRKTLVKRTVEKRFQEFLMRKEEKTP